MQHVLLMLAPPLCPAGMMVRKATLAARNRHVAAQLAAEHSFYRQYDARTTDANNEVSDEHAQWLWHDADWRKWEQEDPWLWDELERRRWAEDIFRQQVGQAGWCAGVLLAWLAL